ncbi:hypothetical protein F5Y17DRAFT_127348 [Xylariaceae sp. FL0594]|nr:hypothetical protein F5Y17DRAFT_127348 [Xylariaceae sp. FL0594]
MTRTLPWKRRGGEEQSDGRSASAPTPTAKRVVVKEQDGDGEMHVARNLMKRARRSFSPLVPPKEPPKESFMIQGDDRYRMVEDEFLATARLFTAHLHAAEYEQRLKAASEMATRNSNISRPTVGQKMSDLVRIKREREARDEKHRRFVVAARKKKRALRRKDREDDDGESTEYDDDDKGSSSSWQKQSLYGLMESPTSNHIKDERHLLDGLLLLPAATTPVITRAAAGYESKMAKMTHSPRRPKLLAAETVFGTTNLTTTTTTGTRTTSTDRGRTAYRRNKEDDDDVDTGASRLVAHRSGGARPELDNIVQGPSSSSSRIAAITMIAHHTSSSHISFLHRGALDETKDRGDNGRRERGGGEEEEGEELDFIARMKKRQEERRRNREQRRSTIGATGSGRTSGSSRIRSNSADFVPDFL